MIPWIGRGVQELPVYRPGRAILAGGDAALADRPVAKLSSNENPLGPSPRALAALAAAVARVGEYPDDAAGPLRRRLAEHLGVAAEAIVVGNGSTELIGIIARSCLLPGDRMLLARPSFLAYERAARLNESAIVEVPPAAGLALDLDALLTRAAPPAKLLFLGNPNNPTGRAIGRDELTAFLAALPPHVVVVVDEAYHEYAEHEPGFQSAIALLPAHPRLLVLRSFSKAYGLAGLRLGFAVGAPEVIGCLQRAREPFNVNAPAQEAAAAALDDPGHIRRSVQHNQKERARLTAALRRRDLTVPDSLANFVLADFRRPHQAVFDTFLGHGLLVRPMTAYGLPRHMRITVGTTKDVDRTIVALDEVLERVPALS